MSSFKDMVARDRDTLLNPSELGSAHIVDKVITNIAIDHEQLQRRQRGNNLGIADSTLLFYAKVEDLPPQKSADETLMVDGKSYLISDWAVKGGIACVVLRSNISS